MLEKRYDPHLVEEGKYETWKNKGYFTAGDISKKPFSIVIPPPNVTGKLHLGHAWDTTIQDIIARYKKMQGFDVCYLPGMDHAGIATQAKVMEKLVKSGVDVTKITREEFLKKAWEWKDEYAKSIHEQWGKMGLALDYTRERFTLDEGLNFAVRTVFKTLYDKGLIYQGEKIINWDPVQMTALSNIEVIHQDDKGYMYYFKYPIVDSNEYLIVATTRPETMFGDVCVVVNPNDERYQKFIGMKVINPANGDILPIIGDEYVDLEFGTGAMKCTPAHDPNDFIIGEKYHFPKPIIFNKNATMNSLCGKYEGMDRFVCREALLEDIKKAGNFVKMEEIVHPVGHSERTNAVVEPMLSKQWFVRMRPLAEQALANQNGLGRVDFVPARFENVFTQWMEKVDDWCISRQLWWGHRIPAYYNKKTGEVVVSMDPPKDMENYEQDNDVLDTWFSSALWPFSTLGWPNKTEDFERYFPTDTMVTAYDIIFFWVSRMIFQSLEMNKVRPFKEVVIHGLVRDELGRKMSKSLGNGVDPIKIANVYGADILRLWVASVDYQQDVRIGDNLIKQVADQYRKIRNTLKFISWNLVDYSPMEKASKFEKVDEYILESLNLLVKNVTEAFDRYDFGSATSQIMTFMSTDLSSFYLDINKDVLYCDKKGSSRRNQVQTVLFTVGDTLLRLLNPILPFTMDEFNKNMPGERVSNAQYLDYPKAHTVNETILNEYETFKLLRDDVLKALEAARNEKIIGSAQEAYVSIKFNNDEVKELFNSLPVAIRKQSFVVSDIVEEDNDGEVYKNSQIKVIHHKGHFCERCWNYEDDAVLQEDGTYLCKRCNEVVK